MPARRFGQIAAVCSSIVLVSGYLLYRVSGGDRRRRLSRLQIRARRTRQLLTRAD
jgi:hypothetical protein